MKKLLFLLAALPLLVSCVPPQKKDIEKQHPFIELLMKYDNMEYNAGNSIQKKELLSRRDKELLNMVDSLAIFENLKGRIDKIELKEYEKQSLLTYEIIIAPKKYFKLTLNCRHIIDNDKLSDDYIYNNIRTLSNYSNVVFNGILSTKAETNEIRKSDFGSDGLQFSYPDLYFHLTDINPYKTDSISNDLRNSLKKGKNAMNYMFKNYRKEKDYKKSIYKEMEKDFNNSKDLLTGKDLLFIERYMNMIATDIY